MVVGGGAARFRVRIGSGSKSHVFEPDPRGNAARLRLEQGGEIYARALCGAGGEMTLAAELPLCGTCERLVERDG